MKDWRPKDTVNCVFNTDQGMLPVVFENSPSQTHVGQLQVVINGSVRGAAQVAVPPGNPQIIYIPTDLTDLEGTFKGEVRWLPQNNRTPALQRAVIWVQVTRTNEP
jgi:hypothetical protein